MMASNNSSSNLKNNGSSSSNRERSNTGGSTGSWGGVERGGLRERSNTEESMQSTGSFHSIDAPSGSSTVPVTNNLNTYSSKVTRQRKLVDWIQKQRLPKRRSSSNTNNTSNTAQQEGVLVITGLDRVLYGNQSAAEAIQIAGVQPPRYLWYMLSGSGCDVIQFSMDLLLYYALNIQDASTCWAISFSLSVYFRHISHRWLVFGDYVGGYKASLIRMYGGYSVIIVLSTVFNILVSRMTSIPHYTAWILTLLWTGIANYFILKKLWSFGGPAAGGVATNTAASAKK
jgi:putative flippase GtrA